LSKSIKISGVVITFNEQKNIERCLDSLVGIVDEIVVVDSFSQDKTEEICAKYKVKFVQHAFEGHIQQKNWAITQATHQYILSLDADEVLTSQLQKSILAVKENCMADGYSFNRLNNYCDKWIKHCGWYPDVKLRLWDKAKGAWGGTNPHDTFIMNKGATVNHLSGDLQHYSYYAISEHKKQANYFSTISAQAYLDKGKKSSWLKIVFSPVMKFVKTYVLQLGFLDGYYGFVICRIASYETFMKYKKLYNIQKK
jgi:glycosyltransferase involved in cell wall biosynthesis